MKDKNARTEKAYRVWERRYTELKEYKKINGDTNVPRRYEPNPQLGVWVSNQRQYYKRFKGGISGWGMTDTRIQKLEKIGFEWALTGGRNYHHSTAKVSRVTEAEVQEWDQMYDKLVEYKQLYGDLNVPKGQDEDPVLACWVQSQRKGFRRYEAGLRSKFINHHRFHLLLEIGFQDVIDADEDKSIGFYDNDAQENDNSSYGSSRESKDSELSVEINNEDDSQAFPSLTSIPLNYQHAASSYISIKGKKRYNSRKQPGEKDEFDSEEDKEDEEDKVFFDAVSFCGDDADLDSIAEVILNKYAVIKTKPTSIS